MKTEDVKKLSPLERFLYWIRERHQVYLRRKTGKPKPWTDDEVLQSFFFTNPYRENDKVTVWFRENIREPLRNDPGVLMATVIFRWFNLPEPTGNVLRSPRFGRSKPFGLLEAWDSSQAIQMLGRLREQGQKIFTGAFMINSPAGEPKLEAICRRIDAVWEDKAELHSEVLTSATLQGAHKALTKYDGLGGFMAYEIVCDLRYTYLLENAPDKLTWCHVGPGARRGLYRILEIDFPKGNNAAGCPQILKPEEELAEMRKLLAVVNKRLPKMPKFELREVEHSCCEVDKMERVLWGDGRAKRTYPGV